VSDGSSDDTDGSCLAVFKEVTEHLKTIPATPHRRKDKTEIKTMGNTIARSSEESSEYQAPRSDRRYVSTVGCPYELGMWMSCYLMRSSKGCSRRGNPRREAFVHLAERCVRSAALDKTYGAVIG
jgi:hypothetical protein